MVFNENMLPSQKIVKEEYFDKLDLISKLDLQQQNFINSIKNEIYFNDEFIKKISDNRISVEKMKIVANSMRYGVNLFMVLPESIYTYNEVVLKAIASSI